MPKIKQTSVIGRFCAVKCKTKEILGATVIDAFSGTNRAKRIRLQTGEHAGKVLMPNQYTILEYI